MMIGASAINMNNLAFIFIPSSIDLMIYQFFGQ
jgi:hypothetical protein